MGMAFSFVLVVFIGVSSEIRVKLFENHMTNLCKCYGFNSPRFFLLAEVYLSGNATLSVIGFELCSVSLEEKLFNDSREPCYVQFTNDSRKINFVFNQTLRSRCRNLYVRAWAIVFDAGKHVSNSIQLPTHCSSDNITNNVWINKKYINLTDCNIEINNDTIAIRYNVSSPSNIPYECHVLDGDNVTKLNENKETLIDLTLASNNTERTVTLRFRVCHGDQRTFTCSLLPKDSEMTSSNDTSLIIGVALAVLFILSGSLVLYGLWKKCLKKGKNVTTADFNSENDIFLDKKTQDECNETKSYSVLLTGKVGTGKSSTGNTILGREVFQTSSSTHISPCVVEKQSANYGNIEMTVVDGPSFDPAVSDDSEKLQELFQRFQESLQLVPNGFDAILFVLRYGSKFTAEDEKTFEILKGALGNDVLKNYGILVLTYGDNFLRDYPNEDSIVAWCSEQEGSFRELFEECNRRVVLFNNKSNETEISVCHKLQSLVSILSTNSTTLYFGKECLSV